MLVQIFTVTLTFVPLLITSFLIVSITYKVSIMAFRVKYPLRNLP